MSRSIATQRRLAAIVSADVADYSRLKMNAKLEGVRNKFADGLRLAGLPE